LLRPEATGYGLVYFVDNMLKVKDQTFEGKTVSISGSGNVALFATEKVNQLGGKVVTLSDSSGFIHDKEGFDADKLAYLMDLKFERRGRINDYCKVYPHAEFHASKRPWSIKADIALPCATQNELSGEEAETLVKNGVIAVGEGANMPTTPEAIEVFHANKIMFVPGKASNAGGVSISGIEMSQNSTRIQWQRDEVDAKLKCIMGDIHESCRKYGEESDGYIDYVKGANIAGFIKVADSMLSQGVV